jgi:carboxylesterase type B
MTEILSDHTFTFENLMAAYFHARKSSQPVYLFKFDYEGLWSFAHEFEETEHDYNGVAHFDDIRYLFK